MTKAKDLVKKLDAELREFDKRKRYPRGHPRGGQFIDEPGKGDDEPTNTKTKATPAATKMETKKKAEPMTKAGPQSQAASSSVDTSSNATSSATPVRKTDPLAGESPYTGNITTGATKGGAKSSAPSGIKQDDAGHTEPVTGDGGGFGSRARDKTGATTDISRRKKPRPQDITPSPQGATPSGATASAPPKTAATGATASQAPPEVSNARPSQGPETMGTFRKTGKGPSSNQPPPSGATPSGASSTSASTQASGATASKAPPNVSNAPASGGASSKSVGDMTPSGSTKPVGKSAATAGEKTYDTGKKGPVPVGDGGVSRPKALDKPPRQSPHGGTGAKSSRRPQAQGVDPRDKHYGKQKAKTGKAGPDTVNASGGEGVSAAGSKTKSASVSASGPSGVSATSGTASAVSSANVKSKGGVTVVANASALPKEAKAPGNRVTVTEPNSKAPKPGPAKVDASGSGVGGQGSIGKAVSLAVRAPSSAKETRFQFENAEVKGGLAVHASVTDKGSFSVSHAKSGTKISDVSSLAAARKMASEMLARSGSRKWKAAFTEAGKMRPGSEGTAQKLWESIQPILRKYNAF